MDHGAYLLFALSSIRIVKHDRIDAKGKEVSGCFVWLDVVSAVLPGEVVAVSADIAPSLGYVDDGHGRPLAVVHPSDLKELFTRHLEMASVLVVSKDAPVQRVQGGVGGVAGAVQATESTSPVLPPGCFAVPSKKGRLYGKRVSDMHLAGFSVETNSVHDRVIRFRKRDHKTVVGDMLVAMGRYARVKNAQEIIFKMIVRNDDKIKGLESLEVDMDLLENKVCIFFVISHISVMGGQSLGPTHDSHISGNDHRRLTYINTKKVKIYSTSLSC